jgi:hypothetical protein
MSLALAIRRRSSGATVSTSDPETTESPNGSTCPGRLCAVAAAPATAGAQEPPSLTKVVSVTGKSKSGKKFRGKYVIDHFAPLVAECSPSASSEVASVTVASSSAG